MFTITPLGAFGADAITTELNRVAFASLLQTARRIVRDQRRLILAGESPRGGRQKRNSLVWAMKKRATMGHSVPLLHKGVLANPRRYQIRQQGEFSLAILPPHGRRAIIKKLRRQGYRVFELPRYTVSWPADDADEAIWAHLLRSTPDAFGR